MIMNMRWMQHLLWPQDALILNLTFTTSRHGQLGKKTHVALVSDKRENNYFGDVSFFTEAQIISCNLLTPSNMYALEKTELQN